MNKKKILAILLGLVVVVITAFCITNYFVLAKPEENIKVMEYIPPTITGENGYQIDKYENIQSKEWLNENEVVTLTNNGYFGDPGLKVRASYCSIYNLNTKETKDFKNVQMENYLGMSPDKKYVLYSEPRMIPKTSRDGGQKSIDSGENLHQNIKILNLETGEITDLNTEYNNCRAEFKWIGNNKILGSYNTHWAIIDTNGNKYVDGKYSGLQYEDAVIVDCDDVKDLGNSLEGKFYYSQNFYWENYGEAGVKICSIDIKSREIKDICTSKNSSFDSKKGKTIVMGKYTYGGDTMKYGIFGKVIMDESGNVIRSVDLPKGKIYYDFILSNDGGKAAFTEGNFAVNKKDVDENEVILKVMDIKTGNVKEIVKSSSLKDENEEAEYSDDSDNLSVEDVVTLGKVIDNICWSSTGKDLSFNYKKFGRDDVKINSYIVSFER